MAINRLNPDYPDAGLVQLLPSSVVVGSGSSTVSGNGGVDFTGANSISLNDVFSATYNNYRILINLTSTSGTGTDIAFRMRVSGSDNTTAGNYRWSGAYIASNGSSVTGIFSAAGESAFRIGGVDQTGYMNLDLFNPFASVETGFTGLSTDISATPVEYNFTRGGIMTVTTSYTGFTFFPTVTGNLTGSVSVYGYRN